MVNHARRLIGGSVVLAMSVTGLTATTFSAPLASAAIGGTCDAGAKDVKLFAFNDFHGRIGGADKLFTPMVKARAELGADNVAIISGGDNIGGSTFESASQNDQPTLDVLKAAKVDVATVGNHEFDKGWKDLSERVIPNFDDTFYVGANVHKKGTTEQADKLPAYKILNKGGTKIAVVGAVTKDLSSLVSPAGISNLDIEDPVAAVNREADALKSSGKADVVVAAIHEGSPVSSSDATNGSANGEAEAKAAADKAEAFGSIYNKINKNVDVVLNAHTHQFYNWKSATGAPLVQSGSYAEAYGTITLKVGSDGKPCGAIEAKDTRLGKADAADANLPEIAAIQKLVTDANAKAEEIGQKVVATATGPVTLPGGLMKPDERDKESPMSNLVAEFFYESVGKAKADEFIGVQNPGGTRAGFDKGEITYKEAALALPFANTLKTTQLTGAQFRTVLEQQWQTDDKGNVPSRPFLRLGLSSNVSYSYDESRKAGERIVDVRINGKPLDDKKLYTLGSGNFLIDGGDNFREFAKGQNTRDTGLVDLTAFTGWVSAKKTITPDYSMRGAAVTGLPEKLEGGKTYEVTVGAPKQGGVAPDTLKSTGEGAPEPTTMTVALADGKAKPVEVGTAKIENGRATISFTAPAEFDSATATLVLTATNEAKQVVSTVMQTYAVNQKISVSATSAGTKPVGQWTAAWGTVTGVPAGTKVCTQVKMDEKQWSTSQCGTTDAEGNYTLPLTYDAHVRGTHTWRVQAAGQMSKEFTLTRTGYLLTAQSASTKKVGQWTAVWGSVSGAHANLKICTQVKVGSNWSTSQCGTINSATGYSLPLTYGANTPGTTTWRVNAEGSLSNEFTLTRTR